MRRVAELQNLLYTAAGGKFDIGSHVEVGRVLFERLQLPVPACAVKKAGHRHPSTNNEVRMMRARAQGAGLRCQIKHHAQPYCCARRLAHEGGLERICTSAYPRKRAVAGHMCAT